MRGEKKEAVRGACWSACGTQRGFGAVIGAGHAAVISGVGWVPPDRLAWLSPMRQLTQWPPLTWARKLLPALVWKAYVGTME